MDARLRRLEMDWRTVQDTLGRHPKIGIEGTAGNPPQRYHILYRIRGLEEKLGGAIAEKEEHLVEVSLLRSYPRQPPLCRMLTPTFHPNIAPHRICIGDQWSAGESLVHLIVRIGEMISYQSYNLKSPLNGIAARWAEENLARLPVDRTCLYLPGSIPLDPPREVRRDQEGVACCKCGRLARPSEALSCASGHSTCARCRVVCMGCGCPTCSACALPPCAVCFLTFCPACLRKCASCGLTVCEAHFVPEKGSCVRCHVRSRSAGETGTNPEVFHVRNHRM
jgi:ubiquitin-protein ligase